MRPPRQRPAPASTDQASGGSLFSPAPLATDAWPLLIMAVFALSNGWLSSCALMYAPYEVLPSERARASSLMVCAANGGAPPGAARTSDAHAASRWCRG